MVMAMNMIPLLAGSALMLYNYSQATGNTYVQVQLSFGSVWLCRGNICTVVLVC